MVDLVRNKHELETMKDDSSLKSVFLVVHTKRHYRKKETFPMVYSGRWCSVYLDAILPADMKDVPTFKDPSTRLSDLVEKEPCFLQSLVEPALSQITFHTGMNHFREMQKVKKLMKDGNGLLKALQTKLIHMIRSSKVKEKTVAEM
eukprot:UN33849